MRVLLSVEDIKKLASNTKVFIRGRNLFNAKERIGPLYYDGDKKWIQAKISSFSGNVYETTIALHSNGTPFACSCSCKSFGMFKGACKHVVGLLFSAMENTFADEGEYPAPLEDRHPLYGVPSLTRPLLSFDELMEIHTHSEQETKKKRGRPPKAKELEHAKKASKVSTVHSYLEDRTEVKADEDGFVTIKPGLSEGQSSEESTDSPIRTEERIPSGQRLMQGLSIWEKKVENLGRSTFKHTRHEDAVHIELLLNLDLGIQAFSSHVSMRIGTADHMYVVLSLPQFLLAYVHGKSYPFGSYFTWEMDKNLTHSQQKVLDWLYAAFVDINKLGIMDEEQLLASKTLPLTYDMQKQFFLLCSQMDEAVHVDIQKERFVFPFVWREKLPPTLHLYLEGISEEEIQKEDSREESRETFSSLLSIKDEEQILGIADAKSNKAKFMADEDILLLHEDYLLLYDSVIYRLKEKSDRFLWHVMGTLAKAKEKKIALHASEMNYFLAVAKQNVEEKRKLQWHPRIEEQIVEQNLEIRSYLDFIEEKLFLSAFYYYGEYYFRPLYKDVLARKKNAIVEDTFVLRNLRDERQFASLLEAQAFEVLPLKEEELSFISQGEEGPYMANQFFLEKEEDIFAFLQDGVRQVQESSTIYASPHFRKFEILEATEAELYLDYQEGQEWIAIEISMANFTNQEAAEIVRAYQLQKDYARLDTYRFVNLDQSTKDKTWVKKIARLVQTLSSWGAVWHEKKFRLSRYRSLALQGLLAEEGIEIQSRDKKLLDAWKVLEEDSKNPGGHAPASADGIHATLRNYQLEGFQWLSYLDRYGFGGILADEMGLGKTLQILSFLWSKYEEEKGLYLVVSPTSLLYNWEQEAKKFVPNMPVQVIEGSKAQREEAFAKLKNASGLVIISYGIARQDKKELSTFLFDYMIIDEAQNIKNPTTKTTRAIKSLKAVRKFALTGTPIENHIGELWSIFDFIMPGYLFQYSVFQERFGQVHSASKDISIPESLREDKEKEARAQQLSLHQLVSPFILRRLKTDVLEDLPDKIVTDLPVHMTIAQQRLYRQHLSQARRQLLRLDEADKAEQNRRRMDILGELTRLRQISCDPALFVKDYDGGSGKLEALEELVDNLLEAKHRILLFSQFTSMLKIIEKCMQEKGIKTMYIDGQVAAKERLAMVDAFNSGTGDIFLISLKAGGTGLNLTGANVVIHYDPWWNPAVENQATDRAHRLGQRQIVQVYRLITKGSIEEKIQALQERKQALLDDIVSPGQRSLHKMDIEDIKALFSDDLDSSY